MFLDVTFCCCFIFSKFCFLRSTCFRLLFPLATKELLLCFSLFTNKTLNLSIKRYNHPFCFINGEFFLRNVGLVLLFQAFLITIKFCTILLLQNLTSLLCQETEAKRKKLQKANEKKLKLLAEVKLLPLPSGLLHYVSFVLRPFESKLQQL